MVALKPGLFAPPAPLPGLVGKDSSGISFCRKQWDPVKGTGGQAMQEDKVPFVAFEIRKKEPPLSENELNTKNSEDLVTANVTTGVSVPYCGGVIQGAKRACPVGLVDCHESEHFGEILEQDYFCVEIPTESMTSGVMTEKLLKTPPEERGQLLARLMYEYHIPRVILVAPQNICV
jgi:hypothetical protein